MKKLMLLIFGILFSLILVSASSDLPPITEGLFAYYSFENETDNTGYGYDLQTVGNPQFTTAGALLGNSGNISYLNTWNITDNPAFDMSYVNWSIVGWFNATIVTQTTNVIASKGATGWSINLIGTSYLRFAYPDGFQDSTNRAGVDVWTFFAITYNNSHLCIYLNGTTPSCSANKSVTTTAWDVGFGAYINNPTPDTVFNGTIDEFGFYNITLTPENVTSVYNYGLTIVAGESEITTNLILPEDNKLISTNGTDFVVNYSMEHINITNATYYIWDSDGDVFNQTTVIVTGNATNSTNLTVEGFGFETYTWNTKACGINATGSPCFWAEDNYTVTFSAFSESTSVYNFSVLETSRQAFTLSVIANPSISSMSAVLWYNGTSYTSFITDGTAGIYTATNTIDISLSVPDSANKSFNWEFTLTLSGGTIASQNSSIYSHEVNRTYLFLCNVTDSAAFINFTIKNAENPFPSLNATFKAAWEWFTKGGGGSVTRNESFEDTSEGNHTFDFCMKPIAENYITDSIIEIDAIDYAKNFHYLDNASLTNDTELLSLYLLNDSKAVLTVLKVVDAAQSPLPDVLISVQFYDVGTDTFYTVAMAKTNFDGEDLVYLNWYDSLYKFILIEGGATIKSTSPYKISETPQIFQVIRETIFDFDKFEDFAYLLYYNDTSQNFVLTFIKPSGLVEQGCLRVIKRNQTGDTQICLTCESSSSATVYCNIGSHGNGTFIASFYATGSGKFIDSISKLIGISSKVYELIGNVDGSVMAIIFAGIVMTMFLISSVAGVIGVILGALGAVALGFQPYDYYVFIGIVLIGGVVIWFLKR